MRYNSYPKLWLLDANPAMSVRYLCDRDVGKMINTTYQLLTNTYWWMTGIRNKRTYDYMMDDLDRKDVLLETTWQHFPLGNIPKHPLGRTPEFKFTRQCMDHFRFVKSYFDAALEEYDERYYKRHKLDEAASWFDAFPPPILPTLNLETIHYPQKVIPFKYRDKDPVVSMRRYYTRKVTEPLKAYNHRSVPEWFELTEKDLHF